jgi:hypothetical protein
MQVRTVIVGSLAYVILDGNTMWITGVSVATGAPGIGARSMPSTNAISLAKLGPWDNVAPSAVNADTFAGRLKRHSRPPSQRPKHGTADYPSDPSHTFPSPPVLRQNFDLPAARLLPRLALGHPVNQMPARKRQTETRLRPPPPFRPKMATPGRRGWVSPCAGSPYYGHF